MVTVSLKLFVYFGSFPYFDAIFEGVGLRRTEKLTKQGLNFLITTNTYANILSVGYEELIISSFIMDFNISWLLYFMCFFFSLLVLFCFCCFFCHHVNYFSRPEESGQFAKLNGPGKKSFFFLKNFEPAGR